MPESQFSFHQSAGDSKDQVYGESSALGQRTWLHIRRRASNTYFDLACAARMTLAASLDLPESPQNNEYSVSIKVWSPWELLRVDNWVKDSKKRAPKLSERGQIRCLSFLMTR